MAIGFLINGFLYGFLLVEAYKFTQLLFEGSTKSAKGFTASSRSFRDSMTHCVNLNVLEELVRSNSILLKRSALQVLIDKGVSDAHLPMIFNACQSDSLEMKLKGFNALVMMTKSESSKLKLIRCGVLEVVNNELMKGIEDEKLLKLVIITTYYLLHGNTNAKRYMVRCRVIKPLLELIRSNSSKTSDIVYWILVILHEMVLIDDICPYLNKERAVRIFMMASLASYGHASVEILCYHSVVRLLDSMSSEEASRELKAIWDPAILHITLEHLQSNNPELVCWSLGLIHEYVEKDVNRDAWDQIENLPDILINLLNYLEVSVQFIALRILKFLSSKRLDFRNTLCRTPKIIEVLIRLIQSTNSDMQYWGVFLLVDLLDYNEIRTKFFELQGASIVLRCLKLTHDHRILYASIGLLRDLRQKFKTYDRLYVNFALEICFLIMDSDDTDLVASAASNLFELISDFQDIAPEVFKSSSSKKLFDGLLAENAPANVRIIYAKIISKLVEIEDDGDLASRVRSQLVPGIIETTIYHCKMFLVRMKHGQVDPVEFSQVQVLMNLVKILSENPKILDSSVLCGQSFSNFLMEFLEVCNGRKHLKMRFETGITPEKGPNRAEAKRREATLFSFGSEMDKQRSRDQERLSNNRLLSETSKAVYDIEKETGFRLSNLLLQIEELIQGIRDVPRSES